MKLRRRDREWRPVSMWRTPILLGFLVSATLAVNDLIAHHGHHVGYYVVLALFLSGGMIIGLRLRRRRLRRKLARA